ncbi:unnamed protein product, partial [Clavelina lepadiformis]
TLTLMVFSALCSLLFRPSGFTSLQRVSIPQPLHKLDIEASSADFATETFSVQNPGI